MGMLSDFLTIIKGTQTNIEGALAGENGRITELSIGGTDPASLVTKAMLDSQHDKVTTVTNETSLYHLVSTSVVPYYKVYFLDNTHILALSDYPSSLSGYSYCCFCCVYASDTSIKGVILIGVSGSGDVKIVSGYPISGAMRWSVVSDDIIIEEFGPYSGEKPATSGLERFASDAHSLTKSGYTLIGYSLTSTTNSQDIIYSSYANYSSNIIYVQMYSVNDAASTWSYSIEAIYRKN